MTINLAANALLRAGLQSLDITPAEYDLAVSRYHAVAESLAEFWNADSRDGLVYPQGSMRLGTVTRNIYRNDEIDIDLVARRDQAKESTTQADLKEDAGKGLHKHVLSIPEGAPTLSEGKRCWTLHYDGFHLDVLPALPNAVSASDTAIVITDRDLFRWQHSNPIAYADWFHAVMAAEMRERRIILSKRMDIAAVPNWQIKTTLQQAVQALKRHRDIFFADDLTRRPASIIITTLAALAYRGGADLLEVLDDITDRMPSYVHHFQGQYTLANPVEPQENFLDRWAGHMERAEAFFAWIQAAKRDFESLARTGAGVDKTLVKMSDTLGGRVSKAAGKSWSRGVDVRRHGQLAYGVGTGALTVAPGGATRPVRRGHDFHGDCGARP